MRGPIINFVFHVILDSWTFISKKSKRPSDNEASPKDLEALAKNVLEEIAGQNKTGADGVIAVGLGWNNNDQKVLIIAGGIDKRTVVVNSTCQSNCKANNSPQQGLNGHLRKIITRAIRKEESFASKLGVTSNVNLKSSFIEECPNQDSDFRIHTEVQMLDYANGKSIKLEKVGVSREPCKTCLQTLIEKFPVHMFSPTVPTVPTIPTRLVKIYEVGTEPNYPAASNTSQSSQSSLRSSISQISGNSTNSRASQYTPKTNQPTHQTRNGCSNTSVDDQFKKRPPRIPGVTKIGKIYHNKTTRKTEVKVPEPISDVGRSNRPKPKENETKTVKTE